MEEEKVRSLGKMHLVLMVILGILSIVSTVVLCYAAYAIPDTTSKSAIYTAATASIFNTLALCSGIVYLLKGHSKEAAGYYKAFIAFTAFSFAGSIISNLFSLMSGAEITGADPVAAIRLVLLIVVFALLLVLAFKKDLGKNKTWTIFKVALALSIVMMLISFVGAQFDGFATVAVSIVLLFTRILMIGTIGFAIRGKYEDKDARGTI